MEAFRKGIAAAWSFALQAGYTVYRFFAVQRDFVKANPLTTLAVVYVLALALVF